MTVCLFDIDGTLLTSGGAGKHAMETALRHEFRLDEVRDGVPFSGRTDRAIARDLFHLHGIVDTQEHWSRFVGRYLSELPNSLARHAGEVKPGVTDVLHHLSSREDVLVGLLTGNVKHGARLKLTHYGLYDHFVVGGFGDHYYDRNDVAREAVKSIEAHCGAVNPGRSIWVIGDTPLDIRCARVIGARVVAVATGWHSRAELAACQPDLLFDDLTEAGAWLEQL